MNLKPLALLILLFSSQAMAAHCKCCDLSLKELSQALQIGRLSSVECVREILDESAALQKNNDKIFISLNSANALTEAKASDIRRHQHKQKSIYDGVPIVIKDNIDLAGLVTTAGTPAFKNNHANESAAVVKQLQKKGFIVVAKANMHELAAGVTSNNAFYGAVHNPYDNNAFAGGSSGGSASAVARGLVPVALGTDTVGSTRIPAALCGIVGFRPSIGRYPTQGVVPVSSSFDTIGLLARRADEIKKIDQLLTNNKITTQELPKASTIKLGIPMYYYQYLESDAIPAFKELQEKLKSCGITLVELDIPKVENLVEHSAFPIAFYEAKIATENYLHDRLSMMKQDDFLRQIASPDVKKAYQDILTKPVTKESYTQAVNLYQKQLKDIFINYITENKLTGILFPTTLLTARNISDSDNTVNLNGTSVPTTAAYTHNTMPGAVAGLPGISIPVGLVKHLPMGIEIDGLPSHDEEVINVGILVQRCNV